MHLSLSYLVRGVTNIVLLGNDLCQKSTDLPAYFTTWLITSYKETNEHFKNDGIEHFFLVIFVAALVANRFFAACVQFFM